MRVAITGGTGLIGSALRERLAAAGHEAVAIRRGPEADPDAQWDPAAGWVRDGAFVGFEAVVHLSGASIGRGPVVRCAPRGAAQQPHRLDAHARRTPRLAARRRPPGGARQPVRRRLLRRAGRRGAHGGVGAGHGLPGRPRHRLGARGLREPRSTASARCAIARRSCSRGRGAPLSRLLPPFRFGLGGNLGNGRWWMPWVTLEDELRSIEHVLANDVSGPVNVAAPGAVTNAGTRSRSRARCVVPRCCRCRSSRMGWCSDRTRRSSSRVNGWLRRPSPPRGSSLPSRTSTAPSSRCLASCSSQVGSATRAGEEPARPLDAKQPPA